jgi:hypothetical protein
MLFRSDIWMRSQKMMEHMEENQDMLFVPARLGSANIVDNHFADFFQAMLLMHKIEANAVAAISRRCSCSR